MAVCGLVILIFFRRKTRLAASLVSVSAVLLLGLGAISTLLLPASCSVDLRAGDSGTSTVRFAVPKVATVFEKYDLTVTGPDMDTIQSSYSGAAGSIVIEVPAGEARQFELLAVVDASDTDPVRRYRGVATADLAAGEEKAITLSMGAVTEKIEMSRVSTLAPNYPVGEDFSVDVRIACDPKAIDFRFFFVDSFDSSEVLSGGATGTQMATID